MKDNINFLPIEKQQELQAIVQAIRTYPDVEMIILFGSYARGDWVEEYADDGIHFRYQSDYDLLIIVKTLNFSAQHLLEEEIETTTENMPGIKTPVSPIVHDIVFVNRRLEKGQYFFSDIKRQGIVLYDSGNLKLKEPKKLSNKERYNLAKDDYEYNFKNAQDFYDLFEFSLHRKKFNNAAFLLHQVTERLYTTLLLVFTRYKPNTHDLGKLIKIINLLDQRLIKIFPRGTSEERRRFTLLRKAYVDARYNKNYVITEEELNWLAEHVSQLQQLTETLCQEKMNSFLVAQI